VSRGWRVVLTPSAAAAFRVLSPDVKRVVKAALRELGVDPRQGKELVRELRGTWSLRARRYRIVYEVSPSAREVRVLDIAHRETVYEELARRRRAR
jgi:mRNA-degrading endonuclease RelE of RelBE toxin-antitoxin system